MKALPQNPQQLFEFAIDQARRVSAQFSGSIRHDGFVLRAWAYKYAADWNLVAPEDPEVYGIYYDPYDEDEIAELNKEGLLDLP